MKKHTKKYLSLFLAIVIAVSGLSVLVAYGDDLVAINEANFPDSVFRNVIADYYDTNDDGFLSASERNTSLMSVSGMVDTDFESIKNLKGIEFFTSLKILRCGGIGLESLDVSGLTGLTSLTCQGNKLTTLDVSNNLELMTLNCSDNELTQLNLANNVNLTMLHCYTNQLTSIDVSLLKNLEDFRCDQNELTSLDVSNNTKLELLYCRENHITSLDLSNNASLGSVTDYMIGEQTISLTASLVDDKIIIPFTNHGLNGFNFASCSVGLDSFEFDQFVLDDVADIANGIDYECYPMLETSENMSVHIDVARDGFYQVNFYTSDNLTERIGKSLVLEGGTATAPVISDVPQCKAFDTWSEELTNISEDKNAYIVWKDSHTYSLTGFDGEIATLTCTNCDSSYTVAFKDYINAKKGDSNFNECLDVNTDGYINAKDYAKLLKMF